MIRKYSDLIAIESFEDRFKYLQLFGNVGKETFGFERYLNQFFYRIPEWKEVRRKVIIRDNGCDLAIPDREIHDRFIVVHHMNPITKEDILNRSEFLLNPEYLICCSEMTHKAIHYGNEDLLIKDPIVRRPNDTSPWRV